MRAAPFVAWVLGGLLLSVTACAADRWQVLRARDSGPLLQLDRASLQLIAAKLGAGQFVMITAPMPENPGPGETSSHLVSFFAFADTSVAPRAVGQAIISGSTAARWMEEKDGAGLPRSAQAEPALNPSADSLREYWSVTEIPAWTPTKRYQLRLALITLQGDPRRKYDLGVDLLADPAPGARAQGRRLVADAADAGYIDAQRLVAELARQAPRALADRERERPER